MPPQYSLVCFDLSYHLWPWSIYLWSKQEEHCNVGSSSVPFQRSWGLHQSYDCMATKWSPLHHSLAAHHQSCKWNHSEPFGTWWSFVGAIEECLGTWDFRPQTHSFHDWRGKCLEYLASRSRLCSDDHCRRIRPTSMLSTTSITLRFGASCLAWSLKEWSHWQLW